jgi:hypothetical protein
MTYWNERKEMTYYKTTTDLVKVFTRRPQTVLDVGSADCEYILDLEWVPRKFAIDEWILPASPMIQGIKENFLTHNFSEKFDLVLCLQVLEHLESPEKFAKKLLETGKTVIISVPYNWKKGECEWHVQDPVDEVKLLSWVGRNPVYSCVSGTRLISVYHSEIPGYTNYFKLILFEMKWQPYFILTALVKFSKEAIRQMLHLAKRNNTF